MTSYLGPDNPTPLSLISENYQRSLQVSKVSKIDDNLFNLGDEYYSKVVKLLRLQGGINIDDIICVISSVKSKLPQELERRMCLINPVLHLNAGILLYEDSPSKEREINVACIPINAESYLANEINENKFDKIIIADGLEMIETRLQFLENAKSCLKNNSDSSLIIFHKTKEILTLPIFLEAWNGFVDNQIEIQVLLEQLLDLEFLIGWNIVSLPIKVPKLTWFNQLYNHYPPIMESVPPTNIYNGLRELVETSFKYSDYLVTLNDRFLLIVATRSDSNMGEMPYKMHLQDEDFIITRPSTPKSFVNSLLRLEITPEIRNMLPNNLNSVEKYIKAEVNYPEEWWGTIPSATMGHLDKGRINHRIKPN